MTDHPSPIEFANSVVHQATGIISVQRECSIDDAFRALIDVAADEGVSVDDLAGQIVGRTRRLGPEALGSVDLVRLDGTAVLYLRGEVDLALSRQLKDAIADGLSGRKLVVDMTHATFIDSTVIGALVAAHRDAAAAGTDLTLVAGSENVMRTLSVSGVDDLFEYSDGQDAQVSGRSRQ